MENDSEMKLGELIHRELMKLPELNAPESLIATVLTRLEERRRCWWQHPRGAWPVLARIISVPLIVLCIGSFIFGVSRALKAEALAWAIAKVADLLEPLAPAWDFGMALANALLLTLRSIEQHWILLSAAIAFLMYLTCLAVG